MALLCTIALSTGCINVPPEAVGPERFDYGHEVAESWKRQTLINVVRLRYVDVPVFMDITSIISSRTRGGSINGGAELWESPDPSGLLFGAEGTWSNTPTITYQPLIGDKFTRSLLRPIPPVAVFHMLESGWPVPLVLNVTVTSMNKVENAAIAGQTSDPKFAELTELLARVRAGGALDIRVDERPDGETVLLLVRGDAEAAATADIARVRDILNLDAGASELTVVSGSVQGHGKEIAMTTRSMLEIMVVLGNGIDVPEVHVQQGRARPAPEGVAPLIRIRSGAAAPADAYAAVPYRGQWYWIEDTDIWSKALFSFLMILFSLAETGQTQAGPVVTVPAR